MFAVGDGKAHAGVVVERGPFASKGLEMAEQGDSEDDCIEFTLLVRCMHMYFLKSISSFS